MVICVTAVSSVTYVVDSGMWWLVFFFFQAEDGIRDLVRSRGLGDVYKRQVDRCPRYAGRNHAEHRREGQQEPDEDLDLPDASTDSRMVLHASFPVRVTIRVPALWCLISRDATGRVARQPHR